MNVFARWQVFTPGKPARWNWDYPLSDGQMPGEVFPLSRPTDSPEVTLYRVWYLHREMEGLFPFFRHSRLDFEGEKGEALIQEYASNERLKPGARADLTALREATVARVRKAEENGLRPALGSASSLIAHLYDTGWQKLNASLAGKGRRQRSPLRHFTHEARRLWLYALDGGRAERVMPMLEDWLRDFFRQPEDDAVYTEYIRLQRAEFRKALEGRDKYLESMAPLEEVRRAADYLLQSDLDSLLVTLRPEALQEEHPGIRADALSKPVRRGKGWVHTGNAAAVKARLSFEMEETNDPAEARERVRQWYQETTGVALPKATYYRLIK